MKINKWSEKDLEERGLSTGTRRKVENIPFTKTRGYKQKGWSPFTKETGRERLRKKVANKKNKEWTKKVWKKKKAELDALGSKSYNKPYWQKGYQERMAKKGVTTSGYLDAKYRRRGIKSYAPGIEGARTNTQSTSGLPEGYTGKAYNNKTGLYHYYVKGVKQF